MTLTIGRMGALRLADWSADRHWFEFEPASGLYVRRKLAEARTSMREFSGFAQLMRASRLSKVFVAIYSDRTRIQLSVGRRTWPLHDDGVVIEHRDGMFVSELTLRFATDEPFNLRYLHHDNLSRILDSTYDQLDFELANLPANLRGFAARTEADLLAMWAGDGPVPGAQPSATVPAGPIRG